MRKIAVIVIFMLPFFTLLGQGATPAWLDSDFRNSRYPDDSFFTGFSEYIVETGKIVQECSECAKIQAQSDLVSKIRLQVVSKTQSQISAQSVNGQYDEQESFVNQMSTNSNVEITGIKTETYYDQKRNRVYAFAYANKYELIGYYKSNLTANLVQLESFVKTAQDLEGSGEKAKTRGQLELAKTIFTRMRYMQDLLTAIDTTTGDLQHVKVEQLYNTFIQMQARLAQAVFVWVKNDEDLFGIKTNIVANKLKAELARNGCSFVETEEQADFKLTITVSTRQSGSVGSLVFCYADTQVALYDIRKQKVVYSDEIAQKGGSNTQDKAGRKAMSDAAVKVAEKLKHWIQ